MEQAKNGRPTVWNPELEDAYMSAIEFGLSYESACAEAGFSSSTLANWRIRGEAGEEPYVGFLENEKKALATWERTRLLRMDDAGPNWTREAWKLERRMPDEYGKRERHSVAVGQDPNLGPVQVASTLTLLSDPEACALATQLVARLSGGDEAITDETTGPDEGAEG